MYNVYSDFGKTGKMAAEVGGKIDNDTKIIEKFDKIIIKSQNKSIIIRFRYLSESVNNLRYKIKQIISGNLNIPK